MFARFAAVAAAFLLLSVAPVAAQQVYANGGKSRSVLWGTNSTEGDTRVAVDPSGNLIFALPSGAATAARQDTGNTSLASILAKITADPATQTTLAAVLAKLTGDPSTATLQGTTNTNTGAIATNTGTVATNTGTTNTNLGAPGATACATDTGSCSGNALWQRIAQRLTSLITALGTPLQAGGNVVVTSAPTTAVTIATAPVLVAGSAVIGKTSTDLTTPGTTNLVSAGFSRHVASTPTVQNASYVSGNCIGGFNAVTVAVNNGQSGFVTNFRVASLGGSTPTVTVYLFSANPSASTCTDKSTFTLNSADVDKLIALPTAATLAAPTGTSVTFGGIDYTPAKPFIAGGSTGSGVTTIYYALVSGSTFTPGSTSDLHTSTGVLLN